MKFDFSKLSADGTRTYASPPGFIKGFKLSEGTNDRSRRDSQMEHKIESIERVGAMANACVFLREYIS